MLHLAHLDDRLQVIVASGRSGLNDINIQPVWALEGQQAWIGQSGMQMAGWAGSFRARVPTGAQRMRRVTLSKRSLQARMRTREVAGQDSTNVFLESWIFREGRTYGDQC
ncbi:MAG: hypothetical protein EOO27_39475 [Comamonadaceae bacterium]|nr:MAG: hypothetical protein EOO27_39475 [Comamonadaceae bacterium]